MALFPLSPFLLGAAAKRSPLHDFSNNRMNLHNGILARPSILEKRKFRHAPHQRDRKPDRRASPARASADFPRNPSTVKLILRNIGA
jgi:hypothetical protein